jgi:vacuolar-type H+-ATPase subunit F/Vma7/RNA polymerase subunit RPABC4/transcription elongation factor Spt4
MEHQHDESPPQKRVIVITDPETADGFLLTGAEIKAFDTVDAGAREIACLLDDPTIEAILANKDFLGALDEKTRRAVAASPISVVELPVQGGGVAWPAQQDLMSMTNRFKPDFSATRSLRTYGTGIQQESQLQAPQEEENRYTCHVCGHQMERFTRICEKCGSIRRPISGRGYSESADEADLKDSCKRCGVAIKKGKAYCPECQEYRDRKELAARQARKRGFFGTIAQFFRAVLEAMRGKREE